MKRNPFTHKTTLSTWVAPTFCNWIPGEYSTRSFVFTPCLRCVACYDVHPPIYIFSFLTPWQATTTPFPCPSVELVLVVNDINAALAWVWLKWCASQFSTNSRKMGGWPVGSTFVVVAHSVSHQVSMQLLTLLNFHLAPNPTQCSTTKKSAPSNRITICRLCLGARPLHRKTAVSVEQPANCFWPLSVPLTPWCYLENLPFPSNEWITTTISSSSLRPPLTTHKPPPTNF